MSGERHMYLVLSGTYTDASDEAERWQIGTRLALIFGTVDNQGTLPSNWSADFEDNSGTSDDWTITNGWSATVGINTFNPIDYLSDQVIPSALSLIESDAVASQVTLDQIKLSPIVNPGTVDGGRVTIATPSDSHHGTSGGGMLPLQVSCVVSLRTVLTGRRGRGRFYLPVTAKDALGDHGYYTSTYRGVVAAASEAYLEGLALSISGSFSPHVRPIVTGAPYDHYGMVTTTKVGDVPDTQRRRRRSLPETFTTTVLSY